jgi:hypothetical protein
MIKNNYEYDDFIQKSQLICKKHVMINEIIEVMMVKDTPVKEIKIIKKSEQEQKTISKGNKMTVEEKREKERLKKQRQRDSLRERYGDEDFKKMRAEEIARSRRNKENDS